MRAFRYTGGTPRAELLEIERPRPGPGEVLVRVGGAGICHTDLHLLEWPPERLWFAPPFTLGHEIAGWVEDVGDGVRGVDVGRPVVVYGAYGCGRCSRCTAGYDNYCLRRRDLGSGGAGGGTDGGLAEYVVVPSARYVVALPEGLSPADAAPLADAGLTPYHAIARVRDRLGPGSATVVLGVGGLGHVAVQILRAISATRVVAVDRSEEKLALALDLGASAVVHAGDPAATEADLRAAVGREGADVVLDFVGADATLALAASTVGVCGEVVVVGLGGGAHPFGYATVPHGVRFTASYWGGLRDLAEVVDLAATGAVTVRTERFALEAVDEALGRLAAGTLAGRAVVVPGG